MRDVPRQVLFYAPFDGVSKMFLQTVGEMFSKMKETGKAGNMTVAKLDMSVWGDFAVQQVCSSHGVMGGHSWSFVGRDAVSHNALCPQRRVLPLGRRYQNQQ